MKLPKKAGKSCDINSSTHITTAPSAAAHTRTDTHTSNAHINSLFLAGRNAAIHLATLKKKTKCTLPVNTARRHQLTETSTREESRGEKFSCLCACESLTTYSESLACLVPSRTFTRCSRVSGFKSQWHSEQTTSTSSTSTTTTNYLLLLHTMLAFWRPLPGYVGVLAGWGGEYGPFPQRPFWGYRGGF